MEAKGRAQGGDSAHRFYISSPFMGLKKEREEAKKRITRRNHAYGDSYGGSPDPLVETCQQDVRASDHYVLILGQRYGTRRSEHGNKSVTELEFEAALAAGLSLHVFYLGFVSDARNGIELDPNARAFLKAFRRRVSDHCVPVDCSDQEVGRSGWQALSAGPGRRVPMLTLTATKEGEGLRIRTEVVTPEVWRMPLPEVEGAEPRQLELVVVPEGDNRIGSPETETSRNWYENQRDGCKGVNVEAERAVWLQRYALSRHQIAQAQWRAVAS